MPTGVYPRTEYHRKINSDGKRGVKQSKEHIAKRVAKCSGDKHYNWKGGEYSTVWGYIKTFCPDHPSKPQDNHILRARFVMEKYLGRYLKNKEVVHHINGNKKDDRIENLKLFKNNSAHLKHHKKVSGGTELRKKSLKALKKKELSTNELGNILGRSWSIARYYIDQLMKEGLLERRKVTIYRESCKGGYYHAYKLKHQTEV